MTMQAIGVVKLSANQANITFSNIPQDGTDLILNYSLRTNRASAHLDKVRVQFNGGGNSWSMRQLIGFGSGNGYTEGGSDSFFVTYATTATTATANTFGNAEIYIPNYRSSAVKVASADGVIETNDTNSWQMITAGVSNITAAVSSITISMEFGTVFVAGSTATLYKITKGSDGVTTVS